MTSKLQRCDIDFYADASIADPVSVYNSMLAAGPVVYLPQNNIVAICGYQAVVEVLKNHECFRSGKGVSINDAVNKLLIGSTLNSDPPQHDRTRKITFAPLSPKQLKSVTERIQQEAEFIADKVLEKQSIDAATELAPHLPLTIVRDLVGLGDYGKDNMLEWGASTFELMGDPKNRRESAVQKLRELRAFLEDPDTLNNLSDNGWARRATQLGIESGMPPEKASELMRDYIPPSLDTTISAISYAIMLFAQHPEQWTKLRENRSLVKNAIEEIVRLNTPIKAFTRYVNEDISIAGAPLKKGSRVLVVFGAANRDAKKFPDPHVFDIERKTLGHVGFGQGVHACLGMNLARLEMNCLLNALADRVAAFELSGPVQTGVNSSIYSMASVPVRLVSHS